jgi:hypothetical protein
VPAAGWFRDLADRLGVKFGTPSIGYRDGSGYVSAHDHDGDQFWNVPFGALRDAGEFGSNEDLVAFLARGRALLRGDSQRPSRRPRVTVRIRIVW